MLRTEPYRDQLLHRPKTGRYILAQNDSNSIIVYQAYRPFIGQFAIDHGCFSGDISYERMSWIKPNFLWMMYRSGWGAKPGQEMNLAIRLQRSFFVSLLIQAVERSYNVSQYATYDGCKKISRGRPFACSGIPTIIQWDGLFHAALSNSDCMVAI